MTRFHNRNSRPTSPPRAIDRSFSGLLDALKKERAAIRPYKCKVEELSRDAEVFSMRITGLVLREDQDGWTAAGLWDEQNNYPWIGEIISVDPEHKSLVVTKLYGSSEPQAGDQIFIYEPDYQEIVRSWAEKSVVEKAQLPAKYVLADSGDMPALKSLLDTRNIDCNNPLLRPAQRKAVANAGQPVSLVWGPPGTGKTFTMGFAVAALTGATLKVLVLAPTNAAVDQAVLSIDNARNAIGRPLALGELIRPGRPQLSQLEQRKHLLAWTHGLGRIASEIQANRKQLATLQHDRIRVTGVERDQVNLELARTKQALTEAESSRSNVLWSLAQSASIIVTTITSALYHSQIIKALHESPSALILDEGSMIPRYVLARLLELPISHLGLFGDVRQLGPIRRSKEPNDSNSIHWISESAFDVLGARDDASLEQLEKTGVLVMLTEQNRMHDLLCAPVSREFYRDRLTTVGTPARSPLLPSWPGGAHLVVDPWKSTLPVSAPAARVSDYVSWKDHMCERSAWIALKIAQEFLEQKADGSVLLLSPFRNQADLLRKLATAHLSHHPHVRAGTVHVSQGQEAELVIFDPVIPKHKWFLGGYGELELKRLFCVAFSRAKVQMVVLGKRAEINQSPLLAKLCRDAEDWLYA